MVSYTTTGGTTPTQPLDGLLNYFEGRKSGKPEKELQVGSTAASGPTSLEVRRTAVSPWSGGSSDASLPRTRITVHPRLTGLSRDTLQVVQGGHRCCKRVE